MKIDLPLLKQSCVEGKLVESESEVEFDIDTSVYSEERWEQNFPHLASKETLFKYISRVKNSHSPENVEVACMLKALFCFMESSQIKTYKDFAKMFILSNPEYLDRLVSKLRNSFNIILEGSSTKNS